jgi:aryl-alcohol dehydrogenase-like predicted oxidoreductase
MEEDLVPVMPGGRRRLLLPQESGLLSGKYRKGEPLPEGSRFARWRAARVRVRRARDRRQARCWEARRTVRDLAIGWLAAQPA